MKVKNAYIIGAYTTQFKKWPNRNFEDLTREAYQGVLEDAGLPGGGDIECTWFGNCMMHNWGQPIVRGQACFFPLIQVGLYPERVPIINVEGACSTASMALHGAWKDILSGQSRLSLAIGVENIFNPDLSPAELFKIFEIGLDNFHLEATLKAYQEAAELSGQKFETGPDRTIFMDTYAVQANYHMWRYGTTQRQIAFGASKNHHNGSLNPKAQYQFEVSLEEVLADRVVSYPLTRSMCSPIGDGAAAALVCSKEYLKGLPVEVQNRAVRVAASVLTSGKLRSPDEPSLTKIAADRAYAMAGVGPSDMNVGEVHDATSFCEIYQVEMLGFCPIGQGGPFVESGATTLEGQIPLNTSGGLVSKGHPIGATGLSMIYELVTQLRGEAEIRQVKNPEWAIQENGGGVIGLEEASSSVMILHKDH